VPALVILLPDGRSLHALRPAFSAMNHGISARFDQKTTPYHCRAYKILMNLSLYFNTLVIFLGFVGRNMETHADVQTHATIGLPYALIPNGDDDQRRRCRSGCARVQTLERTAK